MQCLHQPSSAAALEPQPHHPISSAHHHHYLFLHHLLNAANFVTHHIYHHHHHRHHESHPPHIHPPHPPTSSPPSTRHNRMAAAIVSFTFPLLLLLLLFAGGTFTITVAAAAAEAPDALRTNSRGPRINQGGGSSSISSAFDSTVTYYGPTSAAEGDNLTISCQMSRFQAPQWTHNDRPIDENSENSAGGRITSEPSSESLATSRLERLAISGVRLADSGYYRCNAFSRRAHLLHVIPVPGSGSRHNSTSPSSGREATVLYQLLEAEHQKVEIDCALDIANPRSPVYWSKDGNYIERDERRYPDGTRLVIENATSDRDAGIYLCRTDNMQAEGGARFGQYIHLRAPIRVKPFLLPTVYRVQNESLEVACRYSGYPRGRITWIVGNRQLSEAELHYELGIELRTSEEANDTLLIDRLQVALHNTALTCRVDNTLTADEASFLLHVRENEVYINGPHVLAEKRELRIQCNISEHTNTDRSQVRWYRDNRSIAEIEELRDRFEVEHLPSSRQWTLVIKDAEINDVGNYTCGHGNFNATTRVRSRPLLYPFEEFQATNYKSANVVEGERFSLRCALAPGYDRDASLQWFVYSEEEATGPDGNEPPAAHLLTPINDTHVRIRIEANQSDSSGAAVTGSGGGQGGSGSGQGSGSPSSPSTSFSLSGSASATVVSVLTIAAVRRQDRSYYVCKAHNDVVSYNNTILLRVKDRLAALWPFIGIVCEVLILVLVIFVYEKRRVKPDFDEPDSTAHRNQNPDEGNWSPPDRASRSQAEVRQRK